MPIFWLERFTIGDGRSRMSSPFRSLSIEIAASWPCATAQIMFLGPNAESPPKKIFGCVDCMVTLSTTGMPCWSNWIPTSRSIQGKAFSWPTATRTLGGPAAVHGGVAAAQHDHAPADLVGVAEGNGRKPVDADMDVLRRFFPAGNIEVASARRARADEDRVIALLDQLFHAVDFHTALELDAQSKDVADLLVDDFHRQAEARHLRPDHDARPRILVAYRDA